ncbi:SusE domain-containing protein [uncultured Tenacibaculum sp.]|uniref:SusE domain-containing protein n=1 Tax=uncultured Tenacibaculum sp. TaxID=174713 RepID=UPI002606C9EB|nr:SusE domain-containing protein [uncultured Tenacibaculum sp.]
MKNKFLKLTSLVIALVMLTVFNACDDTSEIFTVSDGTAAVLADVTINKITLDPINTNTPALTLNWSDADYTQQTAINYAIQFASDEAFTSPVTATTLTGKNDVTFSMAELNSAAGNAGLNPFEWSTIYVRVVSSLGTQNGNPVNSNVINLMVYPYFNYVFNDFYLVGNATAADWNNNNNNPALFRNPNDENEYSYTAYFGAGEFKILETKGLWQPQWGTNDGVLAGGEYSGTIEVNPGGGTDPGTFPNNNNAITAGFYTLTINFASKKYSFKSYDASGTTSPASLALEGSSVTASTPLTALTFDGHIWNISGVHLTPGNLKFVTGAGSSWGSNTSFSGTAIDGGADIPVIVEDDYDVWFNDLTGEYILVPLNL